MHCSCLAVASSQVDSRGDVSDKGETARAPPEEVRSLSGATGEATVVLLLLLLPGEVSLSLVSERGLKRRHLLISNYDFVK